MEAMSATTINISDTPTHWEVGVTDGETLEYLEYPSLTLAQAAFVKILRDLKHGERAELNEVKLLADAEGSLP